MASASSQKGAVSLFIVIFAMLIITVVTVSFLRLMMSDQNQATNANLAEGARNSALAGTEDVKRALLRYTEYCQSSSEADCAALAAQLTTDTCNAAVAIGGVANSAAFSGGTEEAPSEVRVQQVQSSAGDALLDQAYTCTTLQLNTDDYIGSLTAQQTQLVPLIGTAQFNRVTVEWFSRDDVSLASPELDLQSATSTDRTLTQSWPVNRPPVLRVQMMQVGDNFTLSSFDATSAGQSNVNTLFLHPTRNGLSLEQSFTARDIRKSNPADESPADSATDTTLPVRCEASLAAGGYACTMTLVLPEPIGGGQAASSFLRLTPYYNGTSYRVTLANDAIMTPVQFKGVQPEIDSTGRANNVFKRVVSRVDMFSIGSAVPGAAVEVTNNFCKDFGVTDTQYIAGTCTP